jgi:hypothetical protein
LTILLKSKVKKQNIIMALNHFVGY